MRVSEWVGFRLPRDIIYDRIVCVRAFERERGLPLSVTWVGCAGADHDDEGDDVVGHLSLLLSFPLFPIPSLVTVVHSALNRDRTRKASAVRGLQYELCNLYNTPPSPCIASSPYPLLLRHGGKRNSSEGAHSLYLRYKMEKCFDFNQGFPNHAAGIISFILYH